MRNKRAKIASLIRQLATSQNPEKNFSYPEIMFDGEDSNGEVLPVDEEENLEEGAKDEAKETSESPAIVETGEDSQQMQTQQPTSNGMTTTVQNVVRITGTNFVTASGGSPVSGVATSTSTTLPMPQQPPNGGVGGQQAVAPVQQQQAPNKQQYTLVRKNGNQVRLGPVTMPAGVTVTPAVVNTNGPNVVSTPAMNSIKLAAAPVAVGGSPVAVGGPVAVQGQPTPVKLINMSSNNIQLANRKLTIVSSNHQQPVPQQQGIVHVQQHQPMPQQTTVQLQQPQHHVVVQQHPQHQQHHHMVQQQHHGGMVQHHGGHPGMVQQHPQQYHPHPPQPPQHHYQYQQQQQQPQQQHVMHVMHTQQQVNTFFTGRKGCLLH